MILRTVKYVISAGILFCLAGCGGGDGNTSVPETTIPQTSGMVGRTVSGAASKGPIAGATVSAYAVNEFGETSGSALASATTGDDGHFEITVPAGSPDVLLLRTGGGSFLDESDQAGVRRIQLNASEGLQTILPANESSVAITPYTDALVVRARQEASANGSFLAAFAGAREQLETDTGFDVVTTMPANPTAPSAAASEAELQYALMLGAIANAVNNASVQLGEATPTFSIVQALVHDLADGVMDGRYFAETIEVTIGETAHALPTNINLANELVRFRNNNFASYESVTLPTVDGSSLNNAAPLANAGVDQSVLQGIAVSLSGADSTDANGTIASYAWTQTAGPPVSLAGSDTVAPTFTAPSSLLDTLTLEFELTVEDEQGATRSDTVTVTVTPAIGASVLAIIQELDDPFQFGIDVPPGAILVNLNSDGTGTFAENAEAEVPFSWTASDQTLTLDFTGEGGLVRPPEFFFDDLDEDGEFEERDVASTADTLTITIVQDTDGRDQIELTEVGTQTINNYTDSTVLEDQAYESTDSRFLYEIPTRSAIDVSAGETRSLYADLSTNNPDLFGAGNLFPDQLTFAADGTGTALHKAETFVWTLTEDGHLNVVFAGGDEADYYYLGTRPSGDVMLTMYTSESGQRVHAGLSFTRDPAASWNSTTLAGAYRAHGVEVLSDGQRVDNDVFYRLYPDGSGELEFSGFDPQLGGFYIVFSSTGACWNVNAAGDLDVTRVQAFGDRYPGRPVPTVATCASLIEEDIAFRRTSTLFEREGETYSTLVIDEQNECGTFGGTGCQLLTSNFYPRILQRIETFSNMPPLAQSDSGTVVSGESVTINVLANDFDDESTLDPASVEIVVEPASGSVSVDDATGQVTYTPDANTGEPQNLYYRVRDADGNQSVAALVEIAVNEPVAVAENQVVQPGEEVVLDGSRSFDTDGPIASFFWSQASGPTVSLADANTATPTFTSPVATSLLDSTSLQFNLTVVDEQGQSNTTLVDVEVRPSIPSAFIGVSESALPTSLGIDIGGGTLVVLNSGGTGEYSDLHGTVSFDWFESTGMLTIDFTAYGGRQLPIRTTFANVDGLPGSEQVQQTPRIDTITYTLLDDGPEKDIVTQSVQTTTEQFDLTNNEPVPDLVEVVEDEAVILDDALQIAFQVSPPETRTLLSNVGSTELFAPGLQIDELTFEAGGTGTSRFMEEGFIWSVASDGHLSVTFDNGDQAEYFLRDKRSSGEVVSVVYTDSDTVQRASLNLSVVDDPTAEFDVVDVAGVYEVRGSTVLDNGDLEPTNGYYRIRPDGTGTFTQELVDTTTGELYFISTSSLGICWDVDVNGELVMNRTFKTNDRYTGSKAPAVATCSSLVTEDLIFQRPHHLLDINEDNERRLLASNYEPECGFALPCDTNAVVLTSTFSLIADFTPFDGNPGFAVADSPLVTAGVETAIDVLSNDLAGDSSIDASQVFLATLPAQGSASVDATTGEIKYTPNVSTTTDSFFYYYKDENGNTSDFGRVSITVSSSP